VYESEVVHSLQCLFSGYIDVLLRVKGIQKVAMLWKWYKIVEDSKVFSTASRKCYIAYLITYFLMTT